MSVKKNANKTSGVNRPDDSCGVDDLRLLLNKKFGDGAIIPLSEDFKVKCDVIPTGSLQLDYAMGVGGWPRGRVCEIIGPEASGKTTLALHAVANAQLQGGVAAFIDAEHALDPSYAQRLGVDFKRLIFSQPDSGDQAFEIIETLVESGKVSVVVVDSVASLVPKEELEGEISDNKMGAQARLMSKALRRVCAKTQKSNVCIIFINQIRHKIGIFMGNQETTPGGNALKFYASMRVDIRKMESIKNSDNNIVGHLAKIKIVKNKVSIPFKSCIINIVYGAGINYTYDLLECGIKYDFITKAGSWLIYDKTKLGMGTQNAMAFLKQNEEIMKKLDSEIRTKLFSGDVPVVEADTDNVNDIEEKDDGD